MKALYIAGSAMLFFVDIPAYAQFNGGMDWVVNRTRVPTIIQCPGCNGEDDDTEDTNINVKVKPNPSQLIYKPSQSVRQKNFARFAEESGAQGGQIKALLQSSNIIDQIDQMMRPMGLRANNVADAYTLWWVIAWHAANGRQGEPDAQIMAAVKQQASNALLSTPQFASVNDAQKQEMAESMLIQAALIDAHIDAAAGKPADQAALAKAVNQGAKKMGLDLTKMNLTEQGFVPRSGGRSDASDAVNDVKPDGAGTALAANDDTAGNAQGGADQSDASKSDTGKLALYSVGGASLLVGMFALGKSFGGKG